MNITSPLFHGAIRIAAMPDDSLTSLVRSLGQATGLFGSGPDGELGIVMSGLAGAAAAVAIGIALTVYFHNSHRTVRDLARHPRLDPSRLDPSRLDPSRLDPQRLDLPRLGIAAIVTLALAAFVVSDMRHAAYAYLGLNSSRPAVEFEIRLPKAELSAISDSQIEFHTDRNQELAKVESAADTPAGQTVLRGVVTLDYPTSNRVVVLNMPGRAQCEFRLRLPAEPSRSDQFGNQFGPWHLADRVTLPNATGPLDTSTHDAFAIRYRVI